jgi:hypothetical protein
MLHLFSLAPPRVRFGSSRRAPRRSRGRAGFLGLLLGSLLVVLSAPAARAQTEDVRERAKALFEKGLEASDSERWADAADYFTRSRALLSRPSTVFNLVGALYRLGRYRAALATAREYLAMSDPLVDASKRKEVEGLQAIMEKAVGIANIEVQPGDASLDIDGERLPVSAGSYALQLDPGLHALVARRAGYRDHSESFSLDNGGRVNLSVSLEQSDGPLVASAAEPLPIAAMPNPGERPRADSSEDRSRKRWRRALWITGSVLVAGAAATALALALPKDEKAGCDRTQSSSGLCVDLN